jgi:hypothetical protein
VFSFEILKFFGEKILSRKMFKKTIFIRFSVLGYQKCSPNFIYWEHLDEVFCNAFYA